MNKKTYLLLIVMCFSLSVGTGFGMSNNKSKCYVTGIKYFGKYVNKLYEPMPGEEPRKLPAEMAWYPEDFYDPPNVIEVRTKIVNQTKKTFKDVVVKVTVWYNVGQSVDDYDEIKIEESKKNCRWQKILNKNIIIDTIAPQNNLSFKVAEINLEDDIIAYDKKGMRPWGIRTDINFIKPKGNQLSKVFLVEAMN